MSTYISRQNKDLNVDIIDINLRVDDAYHYITLMYALISKDKDKRKEI
jgi:hypothetical protein